jgi:hypothetical protein
MKREGPVNSVIANGRSSGRRENLPKEDSDYLQRAPDIRPASSLRARK